MFAIRGIAVCFSIYAIVYGLLSLAVVYLWKRTWPASQQHSAGPYADLLFLLRVAPFGLATLLTLAFAVPSFLMLEPRTVNEPLGGFPVLLGLCGTAVVLAGIWNAVSALVRASCAIAGWSSKSRALPDTPCGSGRAIPLLRISGDAPPLTASGILRPSVWLSETAESVLTTRELQTALRHETVHVRRLDNLRKLVLRVVAFPGMGELDRAWRSATEMAADDAAVSSPEEALDLAAAVIKLSRLVSLSPAAELTTALVSGSVECVNARVERLIAWTERRQTPARRDWLGYPLGLAAVAVTTLAVTYSELLIGVHTATEWLMR